VVGSARPVSHSHNRPKRNLTDATNRHMRTTAVRACPGRLLLVLLQSGFTDVPGCEYVVGRVPEIRDACVCQSPPGTRYPLLVGVQIRKCSEKGAIVIMLTGRKFVFIGGDARQLEVIQQVTELDASATLIGYDHMERQFLDTQHVALSAEEFAEADAIVLPIAGMDDDGRVDTKFANSPIYLTTEHFIAARKGTFVFSGIASEKLRSCCCEHSLQLVKLMELDEVAILNSIPTAEGAIALAMQHTDITIHGAQVVVLGFGRCGKTLARTLAALGAHVSVAARNPADAARITEMGLRHISVNLLDQNLNTADIIFNTLPAPVLTAAVLANVPRACVIIDIASKPGGTDFRYAERRGMTALLAPSLPGLVAPKTAGRIIANTICRILSTDAS